MQYIELLFGFPIEFTFLRSAKVINLFSSFKMLLSLLLLFSLPLWLMVFISKNPFIVILLGFRGNLSLVPLTGG